jgi:predicted metalloprotease with PDZ domain
VQAEIVSTDFSATELETLRALTTLSLRVSHGWLGPLPEKRVLIVYDRSAERAGGVVGQGISLLYDAAPSSVASSPMGIVVVHELMHLYNRADAWWLNEGLTRYLELAMTLRLDRASVDEATRRLLELNDKYRASGASRSVAAATDLEAYSAGALYCFCLDADLRKRGATLAAVHRRAREHAGEAALTEAGFFEAMTALAPKAVAPARRLLQAKGPLDLAPCLEKAGYQVQRRMARQLTAKALAVDVLNILGHDLDRAQVMRVPADSRFQSGDVITSVGGTPVRNFDQIRRLVSSQPAGARVAIALRRGDQDLSEKVTLKPLPASAYAVHESLKVTRTPATSSLLD